MWRPVASQLPSSGGQPKVFPPHPLPPRDNLSYLARFGSCEDVAVLQCPCVARPGEEAVPAAVPRATSQLARALQWREVIAARSSTPTSAGVGYWVAPIMANPSSQSRSADYTIRWQQT
jgi:hypothetical protein